MQSLRDAAILLALLLAVATVRIAPAGHDLPAGSAAGGVQAAEPAAAPAPPSAEPDAGALCVVPLDFPELDASLAERSRVMVFQFDTVEVPAAPRVRTIEGRRIG